MSLPWVDFVWSLKRWLGLHSIEVITSLPNDTPASGNQTLTANQYALTSTNASNVTWTLPLPSENTGHVYRIKVQGDGEVTLSSPFIFADAIVSSLILVKGDMVSLRSDGAYWNVGD